MGQTTRGASIHLLFLLGLAPGLAAQVELVENGLLEGFRHSAEASNDELIALSIRRVRGPPLAESKV